MRSLGWLELKVAHSARNCFPVIESYPVKKIYYNVDRVLLYDSFYKYNHLSNVATFDGPEGQAL